MPLFYTPYITGSLHELDEEESRHCIRVLRLNKGDVVHLTDGKGHLFECRIDAPDQKKCRLTIDKELPGSDSKGWHLHVAIAPTKNHERFEWFLEKATEIGIDEITPLICEHSERREVKHARFEKLIISAMKQSRRIILPKMNQPVQFSELVQKYFSGVRYIAYCGTGREAGLSIVYKHGKDVLILIGPEGDFSAKEVEVAKENGFMPVNLGSSRLRTETAGIVACHTINLLNHH
ncbi:MAG: 16S rRNA (uracil(1498)-N(3))-methyltransferase [bacterium]